MPVPKNFALVAFFALAAPLLAAQTAERSRTRQPPAADQGHNTEDAAFRQIWPNLPPNQDSAAVARGKQLFAANCSFCHGADATGANGGPDLVRSVLVNHDEHGNLMAPVIREGRPDKGMPKFALSDAQVTDLVAFLHQRNRDARLRFTYKVTNVAVGDSAAGKAYFKAYCSSCHSPSGDLAGIASKYPGDALQQRWIYPGDPSPGGAKPRVSEVSVTLPSGRQYSGTLEHLDEFTVSFWDARGNYQSLALTPETRVAVKDPLEAHFKLLNQLTDADMHNVTTYLETLK